LSAEAKQEVDRIAPVVARRIIVPQRIVEHIAVPVQRLRIARLGDDGVGLGEAV